MQVAVLITKENMYDAAPIVTLKKGDRNHDQAGIYHHCLY